MGGGGGDTCRSYCKRVTSGKPTVCHTRRLHVGLCLWHLSAKTKLIISVVRLLSASSKKKQKGKKGKKKKKPPEVLARGS